MDRADDQEHLQILSVDQKLDLAAGHHRAGRFTDAEALYQQVLQTEPEHPIATHMLGLLAHQVGKNDLAVE